MYDVKMLDTTQLCVRDWILWNSTQAGQSISNAIYILLWDIVFRIVCRKSRVWNQLMDVKRRKHSEVMAAYKHCENNFSVSWKCRIPMWNNLQAIVIQDLAISIQNFLVCIQFVQGSVTWSLTMYTLLWLCIMIQIIWLLAYILVTYIGWPLRWEI